MADVKTVDEATEFPEKRKLDLPKSVVATADGDDDKPDSNKKQKIEIPTEENGASREIVVEPDELPKVNADAEEAEEEDDEDEDDYNAEEDDDGDEEPETVDRKGKGVMKDDKGKGKMIADSEDDESDDDDGDSDSDSSDGSDGGLSDGIDEGEGEDDLLAEVDLENILPSRTRRRQAQHGLRIASDSDKGNNA